MVDWNHLKLTSSDPWTMNDLEIANSEREDPVDGEGSQNSRNNEEELTCRYPLRNRVRL